jgi:hypothetical protein
MCLSLAYSHYGMCSQVGRLDMYVLRFAKRAEKDSWLRDIDEQASSYTHERVQQKREDFSKTVAALPLSSVKLTHASPLKSPRRSAAPRFLNEKGMLSPLRERER